MIKWSLILQGVSRDQSIRHMSFFIGVPL